MYLHPSGRTFGATWPQTHQEKFIILQWQIWGYKSVDPPTKHQKAIPAKLAFHIYRKQHYHLSTAIGNLVVGFFFFGVRSCEYSATPKGQNKQTFVLQKGGIRLYREQRNLLYGSGCIQLAYKVSPTFRTHNNRVKTHNSDPVADKETHIPGASLVRYYHKTIIILSNIKQHPSEHSVVR